MTIEEAEKRTILKVLAGSHIHGLAKEGIRCRGCDGSPIAGQVWIKQHIDDGMGTQQDCESCHGTGWEVEPSDRDEEAIIIEPLQEAMGLGKPFEDLIREGVDTKDGPTDIKYVSLRKWCHLACKGNPNFLLMLFAPQSNILRADARALQLREMAPYFVSKQAIRSHLGYMQGQRNRMINHQKEFYDKRAEESFGHGGGHGKPRFDLIEKYGYDTKFGMHLLRLGHQGCELALTGKLTLPIAEPMRGMLMEVRSGLVTLQEVLKIAAEQEAVMKDALDSSTLPDAPQAAAVEEWMCKMYIRTWSADRQLQDLVEDRERFGVDVRKH